MKILAKNGLRLVKKPAAGKPRKTAPVVGTGPKAKIEYLWRDESGKVERRVRDWKRAMTFEAIEEWMENYYGLVAAGYLPEGFAVAPMPFCARVTLGGTVKAEWKPRMSAVRGM